MTNNQPFCDCGDACGPLPRVDRRQFLQLASSLAALPALTSLPVMAGPFDDNDYLRLISADKKLDPAWVRSLFERGTKQTYTDPADLARIGMPVGGLFAGTVYLSGDGRLWLWNIFNRDQEGILPRPLEIPAGSMEGGFVRGGANYVYPATPTQPFALSFSLGVGDDLRPLDASGFNQVTFDGRYPLGRVDYRDDTCPLHVDLEAFSPFIPLNADDSSLPAVVLRYRVTNPTSGRLAGQIVGQMANRICLDSGAMLQGERVNRVIRVTELTAVEFAARALSAPQAERRPDVPFDDFERADHGQWTFQGDAFGDGPVAVADVPDYQGDLGATGQRVVNSHASAPGDDVASKDAKTGRLVSAPFTISRHYISLLVGGGNHPGQTCVNLVVDGKAVASLTGTDANTMQSRTISTAAWEGMPARLEIVDQASGAWGNVGVDQIVFTDTPPPNADLGAQRDFGTMTLAIVGSDDIKASARAERELDQASGPLDDPQLIAQVQQSFELQPGESRSIDFAITWHFPNFYARGCGQAKVGHHYATRFSSSLAVAEYIASNFARLTGDTRQWVDTWYDSTLPYWLLDRTMANSSTLATTTAYRFADGRFWAWEGVGCCEGTCTHVWHYAQALGRLFPEIERDTRQRVDFGIAQHADGGIGHRAALNAANHPADDGHCGRILGAYREHLMSANDNFLRQIWPRVKRALRFMIVKDANGDGMIEDAQPNTLDAAWYGKVSFLASLYLAALRAGEQMAREMGDDAFARECRTIADRGAQSILETYNGEYFTQIEDPRHQQEIGTGPGCYIDQVFGQTWAHWVSLGPLFDREKQLAALRALWKYNFVPDVGPFREQFTRGRWYAMAGDAGLLMCTWPRGGQNPGFKDHWQYMYFNECMSGFEWQVAAHMLWESHDQPDLLEKGLAVARAIHDRYSATLRNPYNEIECSDHYARAMASYGVYQAICGFNCHGPQGSFEFAPRLTPAKFKAAFVGPTGWGTYEQTGTATSQRSQLTVYWGTLDTAALRCTLSNQFRPTRVEVRVDNESLAASFSSDAGSLDIVLERRVTVEAGHSIEFLVT